jgi:hypothetical protein
MLGAPVIAPGTVVTGAGQHDDPKTVELGPQTGPQLGTHVGEQNSR